MRKSDPQSAGFDYHLRTRIVFGVGSSDRLGDLLRELGPRKIIVVTDEGIAAAGHLERICKSIQAAGLNVIPFSGVRENPTARDVEACAGFARKAKIDGLVGLGGGSSIDTAKGCNFLLTNGGRMQDFWGYGKARNPFLPMIAVPTTSGTGSECQSYALISDEKTHQKMACGDPKASPNIAVLDPTLTVSQPRHVTANTGIDAIVHCVETAVCRKRNELSWLYSREGFRLTVRNFRQVLREPKDLGARAAMQLGASYAGLSIELSMLGAAHSAANPLTAHHDVPHGQAVGMMLPHVIRFNAHDSFVRTLYRDLMAYAGLSEHGVDPALAATQLAEHLESLLDDAGMPRSIETCGIGREDIPELAAEAAGQWTAQFNPRVIRAPDFEALYRATISLARNGVKRRTNQVSVSRRSR